MLATTTDWERQTDESERDNMQSSTYAEKQAKGVSPAI